MKTLFISILSALLLCGCGGIEQPVEPNSADGEYSLQTRANNEGILIIDVYSANSLVSSIDTRASIYQKWAVGWYNSENIIVMYSSDIGAGAWDASNNFSTGIPPGHLQGYAQQLYEQKY